MLFNIHDVLLELVGLKFRNFYLQSLVIIFDDLFLDEQFSWLIKFSSIVDAWVDLTQTKP